VLDDEGAGDGDESYLACTDPGGQPEEVRFALEAAAIRETERITRVLVHARARRLAQGKPGTGLAVGLRHPPTFTTFRGDIQPVATSYALHTLELVTVPFFGRRGRPWERADLEPSRLALAFAPADAENPVRVTQAWVEVCTVPPGVDAASEADAATRYEPRTLRRRRGPQRRTHYGPLQPRLTGEILRVKGLHGREGPSMMSSNMSRSTAAKVARWLVGKDRRDEAVGLLCSWAANGPNDKEGQELLAEAFRLDPGSQLAQLAFERMEGISAKDHGSLDAAIARWTLEEVSKLEKQIARPNFMRAQVGFNNNVKYNGLVFHIQTEDSGLDRPHIITHLFADGGRIIKSHKRIYASEVKRDDVAKYVRALMKGQHMEMAIMLREGRFDEVIAGRKLGGMELFEEPPRLEVQKLATKKEERVEAASPAVETAAPAARSVPPPPAAAPPPSAPPPPPPAESAISKLVGKPPPKSSQKARFRLNVIRSLTGGPAFYEPLGDAAIIGRDGAIALDNERFCHPREAQIRWQKGRMWLVDLEAGNGVFLRIRQPVELEIGDEFMVGDQVLLIERNPEPNDGPGPGPTYFYSSPKWPSSFRVVQLFEGGTKGACVVARGTTMQIGSAIGDFVFTADPLVEDQHCLVEEQAGSIVLSDLGSRTGVFVRIKGEQEMLPGDEIIVGRTRLALETLA